MPGYIAVLHQSGGCDYTIACGTRVEHLDAGTLKDALKEAEGLLEEYNGSQALDDLTVYEISARAAVDVRSIYKRMDAEKAAKEAARQEAAERRQLAELQRKYKSG